MTDDELDLLASAYLDGEATPEEVALVERDPALQARVEEFRTLGGGLADTPAPSPALRQAHLTAALAEFGTLRADAPTERMGTVGPARDGSASDGATGDRVVDLRDRASARRRGPQRSLPSWLPAAAVFLLLGGGVIWAANRTESSDDESATADLATDADADASAAGAEEEASLDESQVQAAEAPAADAETGAASAESLMTDDAASAADEAADASSAEESDGSGATTTVPARQAELPPLLRFDEIPDPNAIEDLPTPETDLTLSRCADELLSPGLPEPTGFVPVEVAGEPAELFVAVDVDGAETRFLVDRFCAPLEP